MRKSKRKKLKENFIYFCKETGNIDNYNRLLTITLNSSLRRYYCLSVCEFKICFVREKTRPVLCFLRADELNVPGLSEE